MTDDILGAVELLPGGRATVLKSFGFMAMDDLAGERRQVDWLVKDIIENGTHGMLFGDPESGKTLVLFDLAYCVASGRKWRGRRVKQGAVFYVCGEGHGGLGRRAHAWRLQNNIAEDETFPFYTSEVPAALLEEDAAKAVGDVIADMACALGEVPVLIVLDTLARNFGAGDENSAQDMGTVIAHIDRYLKAESIAVITSHHTGHGNKERARGSMAMMGALDVCYKIEKDTNGRITMDCTKSKDFKRPLTLAMRLRVHDLGYEDEDGDAVTGATVHHTVYMASEDVPKLKGHKAVVYDELRQIYLRTQRQNEALGKKGDDALPHIDVDAWRQAVLERIFGPAASKANRGYDSKRNHTNKAITALIEEDYVKRREGGIFVYPVHDEAEDNF